MVGNMFLGILFTAYQLFVELMPRIGIFYLLYIVVTHPDPRIMFRKMLYMLAALVVISMIVHGIFFTDLETIKEFQKEWEVVKVD